jgi:hypothetical protein
MQLPDFTLFLQMLHFFIVCLILHRLVFAPALDIIIMQDAYEKKLQKNIFNWQTEYEVIIKQAQEKWLSMKNFLLQLMPSIHKQSPVVLQHKIIPINEKISDQQRQKMSTMIQDSLSDVS